MQVQRRVLFPTGVDLQPRRYGSTKNPRQHHWRIEHAIEDGGLDAQMIELASIGQHERVDGPVDAAVDGLQRRQVDGFLAEQVLRFRFGRRLGR